jgi:hypothetical protein
MNYITLVLLIEEKETTHCILERNLVGASHIIGSMERDFVLAPNKYKFIRIIDEQHLGSGKLSYVSTPLHLNKFERDEYPRAINIDKLLRVHCPDSIVIFNALNKDLRISSSNIHLNNEKIDGHTVWFK